MNEPRRVGPWVVERELGRGSFGVVLLARRDGQGPPVALKLLLAAADPEVLARFQREGAVNARLAHPRIVPVLDAGVAAGRPYLVMEFVEGSTLERRLARGPLAPAEAADCLLAIASAVAHAHAQGVIHRDLKPANVLLAGDDVRRPRVTDFGLARDAQAGRLTRSGDSLGTPVYMAPEQLEGRRDLDDRIDVWALGVILFQALTGRLPFAAPDLLTLLALLRAGPPPLPRDTPPALAAVVAAALVPDRALRLPSAQAFARALEAAVPRPELRRRQQARAPAPAAGRRRSVLPWAAGATGLALAVVLGAVAVSAHLRRVEDEARARAEREARDAARASAEAEERARAEAHARAREAEERARAEADARAGAAREALREASEACRAAPGAREPFEAGLERYDSAVRLADGLDDLATRARLERARYCFRRARFTQALDEARALFEAPGRAGLEARFVEALVGLWDDQDPRDGLARLERLWRDDPDGPVGLSAGATFNSYSGRNDVGDRLTARSLELDPEYVEPMIGRAFCLNDLGRRDEALASVQAALDRQPDHLRGWLCMAMVRLNRAEPQAAREATDEVLALSGPAPPPRGLSFRVEACAGLGEHAAVIAAASQLIDLEQATAREFVRRAQAYELLGDVARADVDWRLLLGHREVLAQALRELPPEVARRVAARHDLSDR